MKNEDFLNLDALKESLVDFENESKNLFKEINIDPTNLEIDHLGVCLETGVQTEFLIKNLSNISENQTYFSKKI